MFPHKHNGLHRLIRWKSTWLFHISDRQMPNKAFRTKSECRHYDLRVFHYSSGPRFPDLLSKRSSDSGARGLSTFPLLVNYSPLRELPFVQLTQNIPNQNMLTFICVMHKRQRSGWLGGNLAWVCCPNIPLKKNAPGMLFIWYVSIGIIAFYMYFETRRSVFAQEILSIHMGLQYQHYKLYENCAKCFWYLPAAGTLIRSLFFRLGVCLRPKLPTVAGIAKVTWLIWVTQ